MSFYGKQLKLGVLGGGQLGRMLIQEAISLDVFVKILDPSTEAPCAEIANEFVCGSFNDEESVYQFGKDCDVLTVEIEHVSVPALRRLKEEGVKVYPDPEILSVIQDKGLQKQFYRLNSIPTAPYTLTETEEELHKALAGRSAVQKLRKGGYDGKGVKVIRENTPTKDYLSGPSVVEELIDIKEELSVIVARNASGQVETFPLVGMVFDPEANLVDRLYSPANVDPEVTKKANEIARKIVEAFDFVGLLAIELFLDQSGNLMVNEIAPRPHNSGHQSIEGNFSSQYEQHLRSILNLPLGYTSIIKPSVMVNLLGEPDQTGPVHYEGLEEILKIPATYVHLYGKTNTKPWRKMGHVTVLADTIEEAHRKADQVKSTLKVLAKSK